MCRLSNPKEEQAQADNRRTVSAFVTFREEGGKAACLKAQPRSLMRQWLALKPEHKLRGRWAVLEAADWARVAGQAGCTTAWARVSFRVAGCEASNGRWLRGEGLHRRG